MKKLILLALLVGCDAKSCQDSVRVDQMEACRKTCAPQPIASVTATECRCAEPVR